MRMRALVVGMLVTNAACAPVKLNAPPPPIPKDPDIAVPTTPVEEGKGRVVIDAVGGPAKVTTVRDNPKGPLISFVSAEDQTKGDVLCVSPCVLDLEKGSHWLAVTSEKDPSLSSTMEVEVGSEPQVVRHRMGINKVPSESYKHGALVTAVGGGLVVLGGVATTLAFINNTGRETNTRPDHLPVSPGVMLVAGLTTLITGLVVGGVGIAEMSADRPVEQPGNTTTWRLGSR